ncbi:MFS transporter, partial [Burkholderia multivorans]
MQRTAQDWLVLTYLTNNNASALGITMALQMGPQLIMFPFAGALADRFSKRMLLMVTQAALGAVGLLLFVLVVTDTIELWHVYVLALVLGLLATLDTPARQAFVSELVGERLLPNAVSLNSASFNGARMIGPAVAGVITALVGAGPVFL